MSPQSALWLLILGYMVCLLVCMLILTAREVFR